MSQERSAAPRLRFGVVGANHSHIHGMVDAALAGGGELAAFHAREPELAAEFARRYPQAKPVSDERAILEDPSIRLVLSSIIPNERAPLGIRVMQHGKDFMESSATSARTSSISFSTSRVPRAQRSSRRRFATCGTRTGLGFRTSAT